MSRRLPDSKVMSPTVRMPAVPSPPGTTELPLFAVTFPTLPAPVILAVDCSVTGMVCVPFACSVTLPRTSMAPLSEPVPFMSRIAAVPASSNPDPISVPLRVAPPTMSRRGAGPTNRNVRPELKPLPI